MAQITDVAPDVFRITTFVEPASLQFSRCCLMPACGSCSRGEGRRGVADRSSDAVLDRLQPLRGGRMRVLAGVAGAGAAGGRRGRRVWSVGERCGAAGEAGLGCGSWRAMLELD
jgi:hypothetical protein